MNHWKGKGGLVRDPEISYTPNGMCIWNATIAVNGARYDSQSRGQVVTTVYVSLAAYGWLAEQFSNASFGKGDELLVEGELDQREVERKDGTKERKTRVTVWTALPVRRRQMQTPQQQAGWGEQAWPDETTQQEEPPW